MEVRVSIAGTKDIVFEGKTEGTVFFAGKMDFQYVYAYAMDGQAHMWIIANVYVYPHVSKFNILCLYEMKNTEEAEVFQALDNQRENEFPQVSEAIGEAVFLAARVRKLEGSNPVDLVHSVRRWRDLNDWKCGHEGEDDAK